MGLQVTVSISQVSLNIGSHYIFTEEQTNEDEEERKCLSFPERSLQGSGFPSFMSPTTWPNPIASPEAPCGRQRPPLWHLLSRAHSLLWSRDFTIPYPGSGSVETATVFPKLHLWSLLVCSRISMDTSQRRVHGAKQLAFNKLQLHYWRTSQSPVYMNTLILTHTWNLERVSHFYFQSCRHDMLL